MTSIAMYAVVLVTWLFINTSLCRDQSVVIDYRVCDKEYTFGDEDDIFLVYYYGASLHSTCKITISNNAVMKDVCTSPRKFDLQSCAAKIQYHAYQYNRSSPNKEYTCSSKQYSEYCTSSSKLIISVDDSGSGSFGRNDSVELEVSMKKNSVSLRYGQDSELEASSYSVVGVVGILILLTIVVVVCCKRHRNQAGTVNYAPGYPMANQAGYQLHPGYGQPGFQQLPPAGYQQTPPAGFQQPPPAGFQQPPPAGYQQQLGGYPHAAPQGNAGYQPGPAPFTDNYSAPPIEFEPPPYSS